jgi:flagella basal body P-ring formation protein FlgA
LVGKVSRPTLLPNVPIAATAVREPFAIKQGRPAVVYFQSGGLIISSTAVPLQTGAAGELISLRKSDSGTNIRGVVQPDGTVRVGMP